MFWGGSRYFERRQSTQLTVKVVGLTCVAYIVKVKYISEPGRRGPDPLKYSA